MSEARAAIFARLRRGPTPSGSSTVPGETARTWPQPAVSGDLLARFRSKAEALASTSETVKELAAVPAAVARYLQANALGSAAVVAPQLSGLDWAAAGMQVAARPAVDADAVGITGCFCAIAETGTLMLLSNPESPATISLLPETHIALVPAARLVATMEEAFSLLRAEIGDLPRAVNFVSGPSRTGDIEQTIVLGAHGPCRVHLVLIEA